jgi:hypothetical protein
VEMIRSVSFDAHILFGDSCTARCCSIVE